VSQLTPEQVTPPVQLLLAEQSMTLLTPLEVTPPLQEPWPEQRTSQLVPLHVTPEAHDEKPWHWTSHATEPAQFTLPEQELSPQTILQSAVVGHETAFWQEPGAEQSITQPPLTQVPPPAAHSAPHELEPPSSGAHTLNACSTPASFTPLSNVHCGSAPPQSAFDAQKRVQ